MAGRRIIYLASVIGCLVFYYFYREWLSWLFLMFILALPWFSLLVSLPAILTARGTLDIPASVQPGEACLAKARLSTNMPAPPFSCKLRVTHSITGIVKTLKPGQALPTDLCGKLRIQQIRSWVCDYLGLFRFPLRRKADMDMEIRPVPVPISPAPAFAVQPPRQWKPKPGGGFAENHELRLYRPGDSLQQIHWKLSAKTGKLVLREAMEPIHRPLVLTLDLRDDINDKLGRLLWLSKLLIEKELLFDISVLTGRGILTRRIKSEQDLKKAITTILGAPAAEAGTIEDTLITTGRVYHIGGEPDEA